MNATETRLVAALRAALEDGWVSAFAPGREVDGSPAYVVDHHNEDGDEQRTVLVIEDFDSTDENPLARALNAVGQVVRVFGDAADHVEWGRLETPDEDDGD